ncbi:MAG: hypothetical protein K1X88_31465 [Nannocystaceae bacterium]|nr:hypothetical protein [Nannocystaceae bacterium]
MNAARLLLLLCIVPTSLACRPAGTTAATTTPGGGEPSASTSAAIDPDLVAIARRPGVAIKAKLRVDASGALQKQSIYHRDAQAIPESVRSKTLARWPDAAIVRYESERYADRGRVHEVEVQLPSGQQCELAVADDGGELYEECRIEASALPAPVAAQVTAMFPDGTVHEAETKKGPGLDELTLEIAAGGQEYYVRIAPDGKVLSKLLRIPAVLEVPVD